MSPPSLLKLCSFPYLSCLIYYSPPPSPPTPTLLLEVIICFPVWDGSRRSSQMWLPYMYMGKPEILVGKAIMVPGLIHTGQPSFHMSRVKSSCQTVTAIVNQFSTMTKNFEALSYGCIGSWGQFNKTFTSVIYNCSYCFRV